MEYPETEYQLLCANHNWVKRHENKEYNANRKRDLPLEELKTFYLKGLSTYKIGKIFNVSAETIRVRLQDMGILLRHNKESIRVNGD